jgi:hypothetical protein
MDFKKATDGLFDNLGHSELASTLGISVASIRQARLSPGAKAYREPPPNWESAVLKLAQMRAEHYNQLAAQVRHCGKRPQTSK